MGAFWVGRSETTHCPASHGLSGNSRLLNVEMIKKRGEVRDKRVWSRAVGHISRLAEATMIKRDDSMVRSKGRYLLPPTEMAPSSAMRKDERRAAAVRFIIELDSVDFCEGHGISFPFHFPSTDSYNNSRMTQQILTRLADGHIPH